MLKLNCKFTSGALSGERVTFSRAGATLPALVLFSSINLGEGLLDLDTSLQVICSEAMPLGEEALFFTGEVTFGDMKSEIASLVLFDSS